MAQLPPKPQDPGLPRRPVEDHNVLYDRRDRPRDGRRESLHNSHDSRSPSPRPYRPREDNYPSSSRDTGRGGRYRDVYDREYSDWRTRSNDTYRPSPKSSNWRDRDERYDRSADRDHDHRYRVREKRDERYEGSSWDRDRDRDRGARSPRDVEYSRSSARRRYKSPSREGTPDRRIRSPRRDSRSPSIRARRSPAPLRRSRSPSSPRHGDTRRISPRRASPATSARSEIDYDRGQPDDIASTRDRSHDSRVKSPRQLDGRADHLPINIEKSASPFDRMSGARSNSPQLGKTKTHLSGASPVEANAFAGPTHESEQKDDHEASFARNNKQEITSVPATPIKESLPSETSLSGARKLPNVNTGAYASRGPRSGVEARTPLSALPKRTFSKEDKEPDERAKKEFELARLKRSQINLLTEWAKDRLAMRRAKHESFLATSDRKVAERRRHIAEIQFEQAKDGKLGIDYEES